MCGIAGVLRSSEETQADAAAVRKMCGAIAHRGPDDAGFHFDGPAGLGMRRLSIIDLQTGHQPISNEDETLWIVFNGEIYNHLELREKLVARGHRYSSRSDTETIVHLYEEYGRECVQHLRGMFAFAIWDTRSRSLFVARDRLGIKPLYYCVTDDGFLFGSEIKALLEYPGIARRFNVAGLPEYLAFGYLSGEDTLYSGIKKLMPGHILELKVTGQPKISRYWDVSIKSDSEHRTQSQYAEAYLDLLETSVRSHLMSDVPLGVFLSGGLDSSAIAALTSRIQSGPIETFSVGYTEARSSELLYARRMAKHLNSRHHEVLLRREQFFGALPKLIWHEDEPIAWPSSVALYLVAELARSRVKVVLTGEGSDETLGGYSRYGFTIKNAAFDNVYRAMVPGAVRHKVRQSIAESNFIGATVRRKLSHAFFALDSTSWPSFYFDNFFSAFSEKDQEQLLTDHAKAAYSDGAAYAHVMDVWNQASGDMLQRLLYTDIKTYLVELLMKQDNMSMAASIESRVPFLDHILLEFALNIPKEHQLSGWSGKQILKRAMKGILPQEIIDRPKLGFPTPWSEWLSGAQLETIESLLLEPRSIDRGFFNRIAVQRLFQEHRSKYRDHYDRIWRLLNLELWHRVCMEGDSHDSDPKIMETGVAAAG